MKNHKWIITGIGFILLLVLLALIYIMNFGSSGTGRQDKEVSSGSFPSAIDSGSESIYSEGSSEAQKTDDTISEDGQIVTDSLTKEEVPDAQTGDSKVSGSKGQNSSSSSSNAGRTQGNQASSGGSSKTQQGNTSQGSGSNTQKGSSTTPAGSNTQGGSSSVGTGSNNQGGSAAPVTKTPAQESHAEVQPPAEDISLDPNELPVIGGSNETTVPGAEPTTNPTPEPTSNPTPEPTQAPTQEPTPEPTDSGDNEGPIIWF